MGLVEEGCMSASDEEPFRRKIRMEGGNPVAASSLLAQRAIGS